MPPKIKITKEEIIKTALELVRTSGEQSINARTVAGALNCSTQPIFSNFSSMGICVGGIGVLCPEKRSTLSKLVFRAMLGGMLLSILSAMICGIVALF